MALSEFVAVALAWALALFALLAVGAVVCAAVYGEPLQRILQVLGLGGG